MPRVNTPTSVLFPLSTLPITATLISMVGIPVEDFRTSTSALAPPTWHNRVGHHFKTAVNVVISTLRNTDTRLHLVATWSAVQMGTGARLLFLHSRPSLLFAFWPEPGPTAHAPCV